MFREARMLRRMEMFRRINLFRTFSLLGPVSTGEESRAGLDKGNKLAFFTTGNQRPYQPCFPPRDPRLFLQTGGFHPRRPTGFPSSSTRISRRPPELFSPADHEDCLRKASGFLRWREARRWEWFCHLLLLIDRTGRGSGGSDGNPVGSFNWRQSGSDLDTLTVPQTFKIDLSEQGLKIDPLGMDPRGGSIWSGGRVWRIRDICWGRCPAISLLLCRGRSVIDPHAAPQSLLNN